MFSDRELGMNRAITRRDFCDGFAMLVGGAYATGQAQAAGGPPTKTPAALTGMRGHHKGSFETMHAIRDGKFPLQADSAEDLKEHYDLIVIGGGLSGLAAAYMYRQQAGTKARILILDNHDDFGGHAKRNEFTASNGQFLLGYGGSESLQTPSYFTPAVKSLLKDIGVVPERFKKYYDQTWFERHKLSEEGLFFAKGSFAEDKLVIKQGRAADWVPKTPLGEAAKRDLIKLIDQPQDFMPGLSRQQKWELMSRTSYARFLSDYAKVDRELEAYFQQSTADYFGCGIDAVSCADAWGNGNPGFEAMDLGERPYKTMSPTARLIATDPDPYIFHFPDGNASIARLLVRKLIPGAIPGHSMEDIVLARCDYDKLDSSSSAARIRLLSTVVRVRHIGEAASAKDVEVVYARDNKLFRVTAGHVIFACFNQSIPYIAPELSEAQRGALRDQQKIPLIYTNVLIRNWRALQKLGVAGFEVLGHFWSRVMMDYPVSMGGYRYTRKPADPVVLHLARIPNNPGGGSPREQAVAGRASLYDQKFEDMERQVRDLLARSLGPGGFDPAQDIEAITVNRWAHGYSYEYMRPWDAYWPDGDLPIATARQGFGRIAIANSDASAYAYAHSAIDQAARAVHELLGDAAHVPAYADFPGPPRDKLNLVE